jgi:hypothetical protein
MGDKWREISGMKYKTSEAIAMLEKNPNLQFKSIPKPYMTPSVLKYDNYKGIQVTTLDSKLDVCYRVNDEWELVRQAISIQEAARLFDEEGKTVICEYPDFNNKTNIVSCPFKPEKYGGMKSSDEITFYMINSGTWYVEDSNE